MTFDCQIYSNADPHILCILKPTRLVMDIYISGVQWCSEKYSKWKWFNNKNIQYSKYAKPIFI